MDAKSIGHGVVDVSAACVNASRVHAQSGNVAKVENGRRVFHLMPGTRMNLMSPNAAEIGPECDELWLRKVAEGLGFSYEELTKGTDNAWFAAMKAAMSMTFRPSPRPG